MTTRKQAAANKKNAQKSTGPKTPEGKAISSQNARVHGMCARTSVSTYDQVDEVLEIICRLNAQFLPETYSEELLVERLAENEIRSRRGRRHEAIAYHKLQVPLCLRKHPDLFEKSTEEYYELVSEVPVELPIDDTLKMTRYHTANNNEFRRLLDTLEKEQERRRQQIAAWAKEPSIEELMESAVRKREQSH